MKKNTTTFLLVITLTSFVSAQNFDCGTLSIDFSPVACNDNGNEEASDDFLSFSISVTDANFGSGFISDLPDDTTVDPTNSPSFTGSFASLTPSDSPYSFQVPTNGCADVPFNIDLNSGSDSCSSSGSIAVSAAGIPTMGQWGLIILGLSILVFGITYLKKTIEVKQYT